MKSNSRYMLLSLGLFFLFFVFPLESPSVHSNATTLVLTLLAASGIFLARILVVCSGKEDPVGIEPAVLVAAVSWKLPLPIYPLAFFFTFAGSLINLIRVEQGTGFSKALFHASLFTALLRLGALLYQLFMELLNSNSAAVCYTAMASTAIVITFFRVLSARLTGTRTGSFRRNLAKSVTFNTFVMLHAVPGALTAMNSSSGTTFMTNAGLGLFAILFIQAVSLRVNRSEHERTAELDTVLNLQALFKKLFTAKTPMDVLTNLCQSISDAWQCRTAASWKGLKYYHGEAWNTEGAVYCSHPQGLTVWVDTFMSTVPRYLKSFVNRTVPVLCGLEAEKSVKQTSWESMETMVSLLEANHSEFAGFSRRVAKTAWQLSSALNKNEWFMDCARLSGLIHIMNLTDLDGSDTGFENMSLPDITLQALKFQHEHWGGTGPEGLKEEEIPLEARILSVSIAWEKALKSGLEVAVRDLKMRAGTLYDPCLVEILLELKG
ncbi:hypothetical protein CSA37_06280 [Candidatus Fermentibacteria bacterium]|nr:MAG: hypothetical protein CSA37_06280 [Candidatus Fermentibacteria bacterium]